MKDKDIEEIIEPVYHAVFELRMFAKDLPKNKQYDYRKKALEIESAAIYLEDIEKLRQQGELS